MLRNRSSERRQTRITLLDIPPTSPGRLQWRPTATFFPCLTFSIVIHILPYMAIGRHKTTVELTDDERQLLMRIMDKLRWTARTAFTEGLRLIAKRERIPEIDKRKVS